MGATTENDYHFGGESDDMVVYDLHSDKVHLFMNDLGQIEVTKPDGSKDILIDMETIRFQKDGIISDILVDNIGNSETKILVPTATTRCEGERRL